MAHRNPRAHKEMEDQALSLLSEFLLLNHLFLLESRAVEKAVCSDKNDTSQPGLPGTSSTKEK